jgi:predicted amidophosphoribosyltransferase
MINRADYKHCLLCGKKIHQTCDGCQATFPHDYLHCPHCGLKKKAEGKRKKAEDKDETTTKESTKPQDSTSH